MIEIKHEKAIIGTIFWKRQKFALKHNQPKIAILKIITVYDLSQQIEIFKINKQMLIMFLFGDVINISNIKNILKLECHDFNLNKLTR